MVFDVILASTKEGGIGINGRMAWRCPEELALFREKTKGSTLIVGRRTAQSLPHLAGRRLLVLSTTPNLRTATYKNPTEVFPDFEAALAAALRYGAPIFVIGGAELYNRVLDPEGPYRCRIDHLHHSVMKKDYMCTTSINISHKGFLLEEETQHEDFVHRVYRLGQTCEQQYLDLLDRVLTSGTPREGRNGDTVARFVEHLSFDLREGFPLLTTKKMFWKGIVAELLFFLRGSTDTVELKEQGVRIWNGNTCKEFLASRGLSYREGLMGPMYGYQWRHFGAPYNSETGQPEEKGVDQLSALLKGLVEDPHSRRHVMTSYNPSQTSQRVLAPCHSIVLQFFVDRQYIDVYCYNRSSDLFLGLPFNIASTSLLLHIIGRLTGLEPRRVHLTLGDAHIYKAHVTQVREQLSRTCFSLPTVSVSEELFNLQDLTPEHIVLSDYRSHKSIRAPMIP